MIFRMLFRSRHPDTARPPVRGFGHLLPGRRYRVALAFKDHDGIAHPEGETWLFLGSSFLPYEDGLSLHVRMLDGAERQIRLQWRPEAEAGIIDALERHLEHQPDPTGS